MFWITFSKSLFHQSNYSFFNFIIERFHVEKINFKKTFAAIFHSGVHFLGLSTFFLVFLIFFFKQAWINFIIPNNGIHRINSCKINQGFGGGPTSMIFSSILFVWYLIDCASSLRCMRLFWICYWANLVSHIGALACCPGMLSATTLPKISWICMSLPLFDAILDCLDACLIILHKMHVVCHISELTIDVLW